MVEGSAEKTMSPDQESMRSGGNVGSIYSGGQSEVSKTTGTTSTKKS